MSHWRGQWAEAHVCRYLVAQGLSCLAKNVRWRQGEIDLVMNDRGCWVFVEVRYRHSAAWGAGYETITRVKQSRLIATAHWFMTQHWAKQAVSFRFDVCSVDRSREIVWIKNVIAVE